MFYICLKRIFKLEQYWVYIKTQIHTMPTN